MERGGGGSGRHGYLEWKQTSLSVWRQKCVICVQTVYTLMCIYAHKVRKRRNCIDISQDLYINLWPLQVSTYIYMHRSEYKLKRLCKFFFSWSVDRFFFLQTLYICIFVLVLCFLYRCVRVYTYTHMHKLQDGEQIPASHWQCLTVHPYTSSSAQVHPTVQPERKRLGWWITACVLQTGCEAMMGGGKKTTRGGTESLIYLIDDSWCLCGSLAIDGTWPP